MSALPPFRMTGGLNTTPMEAGPSEFSACVNLYDEYGTLTKRRGMVPTGQVGHYVPGTGSGWSEQGVDPASIAVGDVGPTDNAQNCLTFGCGSPFYQWFIYGDAKNNGNANLPYSTFTTLRDMTVWYYVGGLGQDGNGWMQIAAADLFVEAVASGAALIAPYEVVHLDGTAGGSITNQFQISGLIQAAAGWITKTINGTTAYYLQIRGLPTGWLDTAGGTNSNAGNSQVTTAEHPLLNMLYFRDRNGVKHEFRAYLYSSTELRYQLDGSNLTPSDSLQPDGTSKMFSAATRVWSTYDAATDRIIGFVEGHIWFYTPAANNGEIYGLAANGVGANTPYQSVIGGLRTVIPDGNIAATYDNRIFTANGDSVVYSSPNIYKDIWPNDNEIFLQDAGGNVTGMAAVGGVLAMFKRNNIWIAQSDGTADGYTAYPLPGNVGCVAPRSIAVAGNECWFLAEDGIYVFDGQSVRKTSEKVNGFLGNVATTPSAYRAMGVWHSLLNQYRLFYPSSASTPWLLDAALYCNRSVGSVTFWPQGKRTVTRATEANPTTHATDYGFNATYVAADNTPDVNRVMLGDRYGCIWEMDKGAYDATTPVTFDATAARMDLGTAQRLLVRWVTPSQPALATDAWSMDVVADGNTVDKQTLSFTPQGENSDDAFFSSSTLHATATTFSNYFDRQALRAGSVQVLGRFIQLRMYDEVPAPWQLDAVELEVNRYGRRG